MGLTKFDELNSIGANAKIITVLPSTPYDYHDVSVSDVDAPNIEWRGGELAFMLSTTHSGLLYLQTATSGQTAIWVRLQESLATSTSSTTSTTTSTSSSTSTSTSTSTSSSTSTSTSSSSTTTGA